MHVKALFLSTLAASGSFAQRSCGAPKPDEHQKLIIQNFLLQEKAAKEEGNFRIAETINVNIYWHVVANSTDEAGGYLSQATLDEQLDVLNEAYAPHSVTFTAVEADWTVNPTWAQDQDELEMKTALRKGTYADLNVYFIFESDWLGYAYYPEDITVGEEEFILDGVVALSSTVPGGSEVPYDLGHTLTHEAGHWFGLIHTFGEEGSCSGIGDAVDDTPFESSPAFGCQLTRDSCPNQPGTDPVTNYMDYSDDACFTGFSEGQGARVYSFWDNYRAEYQ